MRKLRHREVSDLAKVTQLISSIVKNQTQLTRTRVQALNYYNIKDMLFHSFIPYIILRTIIFQTLC